jgi:hypothetical protein
MENQLYMRLRGRVLGPYDTAKLQSLAKRGQLSRMHEVSPDSINWVPASKYPDLFVNEDIPQAAAAQQTAQAAQQTDYDVQKRSPAAGRRWWYRKNGSQIGPMEEMALQQALVSGTIHFDDFVWADGMPQWLPARQVPELASIQTAVAPQQNFQFLANGASEKKQDLPISLCKAAASSRGWVIFLSSIAFIFATLGTIGGAVQVVLGARIAAAPVVAYGLFSIVGGIIYGIGGYLLRDYAEHLRKVREHQQLVTLEKALDRLRTFWVFVTINVIVWLALFIIAIIIIFSVGITLPIH